MVDVTTIMASRGKRLGGALLDGSFMAIIMVPIMMYTGASQQSLRGESTSFLQHFGYVFLGWLIFLALHGYLLETRGQTIGKLIVGTQIVDRDGNIPKFMNLLILRYLVMGWIGIIPIIGGLLAITNILFIFRKDRRCIHDHLAQTWVVDNHLLLLKRSIASGDE